MNSGQWRVLILELLLLLLEIWRQGSGVGGFLNGITGPLGQAFKQSTA